MLDFFKNLQKYNWDGSVVGHFPFFPQRNLATFSRLLNSWLCSSERDFRFCFSRICKWSLLVSCWVNTRCPRLRSVQAPKRLSGCICWAGDGYTGTATKSCKKTARVWIGLSRSVVRSRGKVTRVVVMALWPNKSDLESVVHEGVNERIVAGVRHGEPVEGKPEVGQSRPVSDDLVVEEKLHDVERKPTDGENNYNGHHHFDHLKQN